MAARSAEQTRTLQDEFAEWLALDPRDRKRLRLPATKAEWAAGKDVSIRTLGNWAKLPHVEQTVSARLAEKKAAKTTARPVSGPLADELDAGVDEDGLDGLAGLEADYARFRRVVVEKAADPDSDPRWAQLAATKLFARLIDAEVDNSEIDLSGKSDLELACMLPFDVIEQAYQILAPVGYFDHQPAQPAQTAQEPS